MHPIRVAQQYVSNEIGGGLKTEYEALLRSGMTESYEFIPVVLSHCHTGVSPSDIRFCYRAFRGIEPDIIHIRGAGVESLNAVLAAKLARRGRVLVTVHGMFSDLVYYSPIKRWICRNVVERMIFALADGISCVCETASHRTIFDPYRKKMLPVVYNRMPKIGARDPSERKKLRAELGIKEDAVVGVYTGRITREKGLEYLLDALRVLDESWPAGFILLIVGDGEDRLRLQEACAELRHGAQVCFTGQLAEVENVLLASDFFLSPSLHENLSISVLEACAAGLPCLVTEVGGNPEIIQNERNGLLIPAQSAPAIVAGIRSMCMPWKREQLARQAREKDYDMFSDECVNAQLQRVYEALLGVPSEEGQAK